MTKWSEVSRGERVLILAEDAMSDFLYYDRKEDEDMPMGTIEDSIIAGEVTITEILRVFEEVITASVEQRN